MDNTQKPKKSFFISAIILFAGFLFWDYFIHPMFYPIRVPGNVLYHKVYEFIHPLSVTVLMGTALIWFFHKTYGLRYLLPSIVHLTWMLINFLLLIFMVPYKYQPYENIEFLSPYISIVGTISDLIVIALCLLLLFDKIRFFSGPSLKDTPWRYPVSIFALH